MRLLRTPTGGVLVMMSTGTIATVKTFCMALVINRRGRIPTEPGFFAIASAMPLPDIANRDNDVTGCPFITV